jgi:cytochrome c
MKSSKIFAAVAVALLNVALCTVAVGQDKATAQEVVAKVREAASTLSKTGDVAPFNQKQSPWVWKDTYIFVDDCDKKVQVAHPIKPELVGKDFMSIKDTKGKNVFPEGFCDAAKKPSGVWLRVLVAEARREGGLPQASLMAWVPKEPRMWWPPGSMTTRQPSRNCQS